MTGVDYGIATLFAKRTEIHRNMLHFHGKSVAILGIASKCGAHGGISVAHTEV